MDIEIHGCNKQSEVKCLDYLKMVVNNIEKNEFVIQELSVKKVLDLSYGSSESGTTRDIGDRILTVEYNILQKKEAKE